MKLGVCYYPEQWPETQWAGDLADMRKLGLTYVRLGEFAWSRIEPEPDHLSWAWLDTILDLVRDHRLQAVLGTPTATPPRWLVQAHPEILPRTPDGQVRGFGSRRHTCFSSPTWHHAAARICRLMAQRYGRHDAVAGWQLDNEYGCHDTVRCACDACRRAFSAWLRDRYQTIESLNTAWGTSFWSQTYESFYAVPLPVGTVTEANPAHRLDYFRFASDRLVSFNRMQADIVRNASPGRFITHNFMGFFFQFDAAAVAADLDFASWDSYPLGFTDRSTLPEPLKNRYARTGHPDMAAFHHDLYRGLGRGRWWVMEQQPGPVNWGSHNPAPGAGMVRLWTWEAFAHGAEVVSYFRWRQARFGQEQMHSGLRCPDNQPDVGEHEVEQVIRESLSLPPSRRAPVALVIDFEAAWVFDIQPQGASFSYPELLFTWYGAARALGLDVDIVPATANLADWPLVLVPSLPILKGSLVGRCIVVGPRTGSKTADFQIPLTLPPDGLLPLRIPRVESLRPGLVESLSWNGQDYELTRWREGLETDLPALARFGDGTPAAVRSGALAYLGFWPSMPFLVDFLEAECAALDIPTVRLPPDLRLRSCGGVRFAFNYGPEPLELPLAATEFLLGGREIPAHGVAAWT